MSSDDDLVKEFRDEARDRLDQVEACLLGLECGDAEAINRAFHALHTIKGNASFFDFMAVNRLAHQLESLLDDMRTGRIASGPGIVDVLFQGVDRLRRLIAEAADGGGIVVADVIERIVAIRKASRPPDTSPVHTLALAVLKLRPGHDRRPRLGEWLIGEGLVAPATIIQALIAQDRLARHPLDILVEEAGCDPGTALALSAEAEDRGLHPFPLAVARRAVMEWTVERLQARLHVSRPPLGRVLTELKLVEAARMRDLLNRYFTEASPGWAPVAPVAPPAVPAAAPTAAAWFPAPARIQLSDDLRADLQEMTASDARQRLEEGLLSLRGEAPLGPVVDRLYRDLHSMKGSFGFLGAELTQRVVHAMEDALSLCKRRPEALHLLDREALIDALLAGVDLVWRLRDACLRAEDEASAGVHPQLPAWKDTLDQASHQLVAGMDAHATATNLDITSEF